ncbi:MAG: hypothetical protein ATN35_04260 [Epulopiscium sp. Nele67-Bin004]|nr:MAG: hypothetical protein ATN35_04260 [Epulopiscium sp. Nele67-Bin004]
MNKKVKPQLLNLVFISILCVFSFLWWVTGGNSSEDFENKTLTSKPNFIFNDITTYPLKFEIYYTDHLPFKADIVNLNGWFKYIMFNKYSNSSVIQGKEGWLYYYYTLADYQRMNLYDDEKLDEITDKFVGMQQELEVYDIEFYLLVGPNKNTIYPEYMPSYYMQFDEQSRLEQLFEHIETNTSISIINPTQSLLSYKDEYQLYWKFDTHWNTVGSYIAFKEATDVMGIQNIPTIEESDISIIEGKGNFDLKNLLGFEGLKENEIYYSLDFNPEEKLDMRLLIFGDSFSVGLSPYFIELFEEVIIYTDGYDIDKVIEFNPDIVIFEKVERNMAAGTFWN